MSNGIITVIFEFYVEIGPHKCVTWQNHNVAYKTFCDLTFTLSFSQYPKVEISMKNHYSVEL